MANIVKYRFVWLLVCIQLCIPSRSVSTSSPPPTDGWINTPVPLYYVIALAALFIIVVVSCIICLICACTRRRVNQACITTVQESLKEKVEAECGNQLMTLPTVDEEIPLPTTKPKKASITEESTGNLEDGDICNDINKKGNEASNVINETANKRKEPLYAEVKKDKKVKQSKATNVVYAELVVLENTHDTMGTRQNTNYAEITRLAQSPRNMTPVED